MTSWLLALLKLESFISFEFELSGVNFLYKQLEGLSTVEKNKNKLAWNYCIDENLIPSLLFLAKMNPTGWFAKYHLLIGEKKNPELNS